MTSLCTLIVWLDFLRALIRHFCYTHTDAARSCYTCQLLVLVEQYKNILICWLLLNLQIKKAPPDAVVRARGRFQTSLWNFSAASASTAPTYACNRRSLSVRGGCSVQARAPEASTLEKKNQLSLK